MKIKLFITVMLLFTAMVLVVPMSSTGAAPPQEVPVEVTDAAWEGLPKFLKAILYRQLQQFNFESPQELERATRATVSHPYNPCSRHSLMGG